MFLGVIHLLSNSEYAVFFYSDPKNFCVLSEIINTPSLSLLPIPVTLRASYLAYRRELPSYVSTLCKEKGR